jgi:hypothetical protein
MYSWGVRFAVATFVMLFTPMLGCENPTRDQCPASDHDPDNCGICGQRCLTGRCEAGLCRATDLGDGFVFPGNIVVDDESIYVWSQSMLYRLPVSGGNVSALATDAIYRGLAVDQTSAFSVRSRDGAALDQIVAISKLTGEARVVGEVDDGGDVAVDDVNIYVGALRTQLGPSNQPPPSAILRVPKAGGQAEVVAEHVGSPVKLLVHGEDLFFVDLTTNRLMRVAKRGGTPSVFAQASSYIRGLAVCRGMIFYSDTDLHEVPLSGGTPSVARAGVSSRLAALGTSLYWTGSDGTVWRSDARGKESRIARFDSVPLDITVRGDFLYGSLAHGTMPRTGRIVRVGR